MASQWRSYLGEGEAEAEGDAEAEAEAEGEGEGEGEGGGGGEAEAEGAAEGAGERLEDLGQRGEQRHAALVQLDLQLGGRRLLA